MSNLPAGPDGGTEPRVFDERDRIVILTPCYDRQATTDYQDGIEQCQQVPSARFRMSDGSVQILPVVAGVIRLSNESHIDRARNTLLYKFEKKHYRFGLWFDGDQVPDPMMILSLWRHLMEGVAVVCGLVALKDIVPTFVANTIKGEVPDPKTGLQRIQDGGTGCMAFNREKTLDVFRTEWPKLVREKIAAAISDRLGGFVISPEGIEDVILAMSKLGLCADLHYVGNQNTVAAGRVMYAYMASGIVHRAGKPTDDSVEEPGGRPDWLSEDWMFCHRCKLLGIPIYADVTVKIPHLGRQLYPVPPEQLVEAALRVTSGVNPPFNRGLSSAASQVLTALHKDINDQSITVLHATRRPEQALKVREMYLKRAGVPVEYIFGLDWGDTHSIELLSKYPHTIALGGGGIVAAINAAAEQMATGKILVMAADDCHPPENWAIDVREAFAGQLHEPRVLMTSDGYSEQALIPHPIMTRAFYQAQGYFFCPEYPHLFCDTELTVRAAEAGQIIDGRHLVFKHEHPMFTGTQPDAIALERNSKEAWEAGKAIFKRRNPNSNHPHAK